VYDVGEKFPGIVQRHISIEKERKIPHIGVFIYIYIELLY